MTVSAQREAGGCRRPAPTSCFPHPSGDLRYADPPQCQSVRVSPHATLIYTGQGGDDLVVAQPIVVEILGKPARAFGYDKVASADDTHTTAVALLSLEDGTRLTVTELLPADPRRRSLRLDRKVEVTETGTANGLRIGFSTESEVGGAVEDAWQFFIPGTLYNRNDNDGDGVRTTSAPTAGTSGTTRTACWQSWPDTRHRGDLRRRPSEQADVRHAITPEELVGAVLRPGNGYRVPRPAPVERQVGTAGQLPVLGGVHVQPGHRPDGVGGIHARTARVLSGGRVRAAAVAAPASRRRSGRGRHECGKLGTSVQARDLAQGAVEYRQLLTQLYYREWEPAENPKQPAGYLVHFSPRTGETLGLPDRVRLLR